MYTGGIRKASIPLNESIPDLMPNLHTYFKFVVVRHPLDRLASAYQDKVQRQYRSDTAKKVKVMLLLRDN